MLLQNILQVVMDHASNICKLGSTANSTFTTALKAQVKNKPGCALMVT